MFYDKEDEGSESEGSEQVFKIIIIGESGVGKTCLAHRFATGKFPERTEATIGVDFWERKLNLDGSKIRLQIWDTAGQERFRKSMVVHYYRNVSAVIFMYDITREGSFKALATWLQEYEHYGLSDEGEVPKLMIGNKCDLIHERVVSSNQARKFADLHSMPVWEVSTKNDEELETIESIFLTLSHKLVSSRSFMDRPRFFASVDSINDSMRSKSGKPHKARHSQKRIKLKPGQQPKRKCCESS
ncbi:putative Ras-related protein Rab-33 [Acropora palmata]|uniref:putative Ras-related protein Rab-33 n=1 Tax=Acropora palmata TaxID=6131 RepID=UPI003DA1073E